MRRRSRAGSKPVKTRQRKAAAQKRRNAPKVRARVAPVPDRETEVALKANLERVVEHPFLVLPPRKLGVTRISLMRFTKTFGSVFHPAPEVTWVMK
jgi:hypothetical protein